MGRVSAEGKIAVAETVLGSKVSNYSRRASDWYVEPPFIVERLLEVEDFPGVSWDPACGQGTIPTVLRGQGLRCRASDLVDRGFPGARAADFLATRPKPLVDHIISNPPFAVIEEWVRLSLAVSRGKVALLLRLAFLEAGCRDGLFATTPLARVWVSKRRVNMPPGDFTGKRHGTKIPVAWFVWDRTHPIGAPWSGGRV